MKGIKGFQKGHKINQGKKNHLGFKHSEETRKKISLKGRGHIPWNKGKSWPEEMRERIRQTNKRKGIEPKVKFVGAGKKHWNWKGGITGPNRVERNRFRRTVQKHVLERDDYTCLLCGERGGKLQVDHIQPWAKYVELRFDMNNCRTVCDKCHYKITFGKELSPNSKNWGYHF